MPWTASDATEHTKKAKTAKLKKQWAATANAVRAKCIEDGGTEKFCDGKAIRIANAKVSGQVEEAGVMGYSQVRQAADELMGLIKPLLDDGKLDGSGIGGRLETLETLMAGLPEGGEPLFETAHLSLGDGKITLAEVIEFYRDYHLAVIGPLEEAVATDADKKAKTTRAKRYGIAEIAPPKGNIIKPKKYADVSENAWGDPTNWKYLADASHARAALAYFNKGNAKSAGGYSDASFGIVGRRLAEMISEHLPGTYLYKDGMLAQRGKKAGSAEAVEALWFAISQFTEIDGSLTDFISDIRLAFGRKFNRAGVADVPVGAESEYLYVRDVFQGHPELGNCLVVESGMQLYQVPFSLGENDEPTFSARDEWIEVRLTYVGLEASESAGGIEETHTEDGGNAMDLELTSTVSLEEWDFAEAATGQIVGEITTTEEPSHVVMEVALIEPGWGRKDHNNYYTREVLARDAHIFKDVKMYATNHTKHEEPNEVGIVMESPIGFTPTGAPIAKVGIFDPPFAEKVRNRSALDALGSLECSILARGTRRPARIDGEQGFLVEAITEAKSVDWVSKAGAGGRALNLVESAESEGGEAMSEGKKQATDTVVIEAGSEAADAGTEEVLLSEARIVEVVDASPLPEAFRTHLRSVEYATEEALTGAVEAAVSEFKEAVGSGSVFGQGASEAGASETDQPLSSTEIVEQEQEWYKARLVEVGIVA